MSNNLEATITLISPDAETLLKQFELLSGELNPSDMTSGRMAVGMSEFGEFVCKFKSITDEEIEESVKDEDTASLVEALLKGPGELQAELTRVEPTAEEVAEHIQSDPGIMELVEKLNSIPGVKVNIG